MRAAAGGGAADSDAAEAGRKVAGAVGTAIEAAPVGDGAAAAVKAAERVVGERPEAVARARDAREGNAGIAEAGVSVARAPAGDRSNVVSLSAGFAGATGLGAAVAGAATERSAGARAGAAERAGDACEGNAGGPRAWVGAGAAAGAGADGAALERLAVRGGPSGARADGTEEVETDVVAFATILNRRSSEGAAKPPATAGSRSVSVAVVSRLVESTCSSMSAGLSPAMLLRIPPGCSARSPPAVAGAEVLPLSPLSASTTMARRAVIKSSWLPLVLVAVAACRAARSAAIVAAGPPVRVLGFMRLEGARRPSSYLFC